LIYARRKAPAAAITATKEKLLALAAPSNWGGELGLTGEEVLTGPEG
jgi:hypothetical protein